MVSVSRKETALTEDTISQLVETTVEKSNSKQKLVRDIGSNETLKGIKNTLQIIKEQNDEIIGEEYDN